MMKLIKEVPFGKASARVSVSGFVENVSLDGDVLDSIEVYTSAEIEIIADGKVVAKGDFATVLEYNRFTDTFFDRVRLDRSKKYTKVGDKAIALGEESGRAINEAIAKMKAEIEKELQGVSEAEKEEKKEIEIAINVVKLAENEGVENLMSAAEIKVWRKQYNDLHNEAEEGYIPTRISREDYQKQISFLTRKGIV